MGGPAFPLIVKRFPHIAGLHRPAILLVLVPQPEFHRFLQFKVEAGHGGTVEKIPLQILVGKDLFCLSDGVQIVLAAALVNVTIQQKHLAIADTDVRGGALTLPRNRVLGQTRLQVLGNRKKSWDSRALH